MAREHIERTIVAYLLVSVTQQIVASVAKFWPETPISMAPADEMAVRD